MPISIQCSQCNRAYRVNDKLAGQKVRCRDCGAAIDIPGEMPEIPADAESRSRIPGLPDLRALFGAAAQPQRPAATREVNFIDAPDAPVRRRRWVRKPGHPLLESIDELIKAVGLLLIVGSVVVWIVHIYKTSPQGLSIAALAPMAAVLLVIAGVISPIVAFGINAAVKIIKFPPRDDSYIRTVIAFMLPLSAGMLAGWPGAADKLSILPELGWAISPVLFIYFFRAELFEWGVSVGAAVVGLGVGLIATSMVVGIITSMTGVLYKDMLPQGPWLSLAKGQSLPAIASKAPATAPESAPAPLAAATAPAVTTPPPASSPAAVPNPAALAMNSSQENPAPAEPANPLAPRTHQPAPEVPHQASLQSKFFSDVTTTQAELSDVSHVVVAATPNGTMLVIKNGDTEAVVEKWDVNPLAKKGDATFPLFPKKSNEYLVGPKGDFLVELGLFPRDELTISTFDNKIPKKNVPLDVVNAVPSLVGFYDPGHFYVRWDQGSSPQGAAKLQQWNATGGQSGRTTAAISAAPPEGSIVIGPGGRTLAVFEATGQLALYNLESGAVQRKIKPSDLAFTFVNMAFSPDGSQIAVYGLVSDVPTISSFKVAQGTPVATAVLARSWTRPRNDPMKHRLLWFQNGHGEDFWLANGNELLDPDTGRKIGSLDLDGVIDQQLVASDTLVLELGGSKEGCENLAFAKWDDAALHAALAKIH